MNVARIPKTYLGLGGARPHISCPEGRELRSGFCGQAGCAMPLPHMDRLGWDILRIALGYCLQGLCLPLLSLTTFLTLWRPEVLL